MTAPTALHSSRSKEVRTINLRVYGDSPSSFFYFIALCVLFARCPCREGGERAVFLFMRRRWEHENRYGGHFTRGQSPKVAARYISSPVS